MNLFGIFLFSTVTAQTCLNGSYLNYYEDCVSVHGDGIVTTDEQCDTGGLISTKY